MIAELTDIRHQDALRFNIAGESKEFDCKLIEPGIVSYRDQGGGIELLRKETLDRCMATVVGNPLILGHTYVTASNRMELENGVIHEWSYNPEDGWFHVKGTVDTETAKVRMKVQRPSCGYRVKTLGAGGVYHGIRYDAEILDLEFNHLAIVESPRYEDATFRINSLKGIPNMKVFKFLKKLLTRENGADGKPVESVKTESHEVSGDTEIEVDGVMVKLNSLADTYIAQTKEAVIRTASGDDEVEVDGKNVKLNELVDAYRKARCNEVKETKAEEKEEKRENAAAPSVVAPEPVIGAAPAAPAAPAESEADRIARENGARAFQSLNQARENGPVSQGYSTSSGSLRERCERGAKRY